MARSASGGNVSADMRPTDYRGAVKRLETIDARKSKQQKIAKEIGDVYSACEGICGVDKTASKIFMLLRKLDDNDRRNTFRDLNGLLDASGIMEETADLVDKAEDKKVQQRFRVVKGGANGDADGGEGIDEEIEELDDDGSVSDDEIDELLEEAYSQSNDGDDEFTEATEEELASQKGRKEAQEAKSVRGSGAKKGETEPYTGDNSDLADAGE